MASSTLSQRAARRRGERHHGDGDRRVAQAIEARRRVSPIGWGGPGSTAVRSAAGMLASCILSARTTSARDPRSAPLVTDEPGD
jgi:hypothetical protein